MPFSFSYLAALFVSLLSFQSVSQFKFTGPPVEVGVTMYVLSISSVSEVLMVHTLFIPSYFQCVFPSYSNFKRKPKWSFVPNPYDCRKIIWKPKVLTEKYISFFNSSCVWLCVLIWNFLFQEKTLRSIFSSLILCNCFLIYLFLVFHCYFYSYNFLLYLSFHFCQNQKVLFQT